ncbi:tetraacyldisaccharide 4'-kinase [Candidatus Binatia bacterium]|nr:tetraacyldisaccharide 4'-kinase [Candidatus Binatia bacterium]
MTGLGQQLRDVVWARRGAVGWAGWLLLQPLSAAFRLGVAARHLAYRAGVLRSERGVLPVVSVGNLATGGTGKTPVTLWLARALAADGRRVAIVMRGYGGAERGVRIVSRGHGPEAAVDVAGDEASMLARSFAGVVIVAPRRIDGVAAAAGLGCEVVVLDDGFQHRALARDFDLVLLNGRAGGLLPAGPLREPASALRRADAVAVVRKADGDRVSLPAAAAGKPVFEVRFVAQALVESDAGQWREMALSGLSGHRIGAVCGIAAPASFFAQLRQWDAELAEVFEYPDHYAYDAADWQRLNRAAHRVDFIVTTEKDLVKLERFPFARGKLVALRIGVEVERGQELLAMIRQRVATR